MIRLEKAKGEKTMAWEGCLENGGIKIRHGTKGRTMRTITIPEGSCGGNPQAKLDELIVQQLQDGYTLVEGQSEAEASLRTARNELANRQLKEALEETESSSYASW